MNVTFDTNVLLSATLWEGSVAEKVLSDLLFQRVKIFVSPFILREYTKVLRRDFNFSEEKMERFLKRICGLVEVIIPTTRVYIVEKDPNDNPIIECALDSNSEYIITYDKHLLNLKSCKNIRIIRPEEARAIF